MKLLQTLKQVLYLIFKYPKFNPRICFNYNKYWLDKRGKSLGSMNSYQLYRAKWICERIDIGSSVLDIGCGDGVILKYLIDKKRITAYGTDISDHALTALKDSEIKIFKCDLTNYIDNDSFPIVDHVLALEVLEHVPDAENLLLFLETKAIKSVFVSFPNTGYIAHRFRLLFGSFPLQWRLHPSEHLRFWTYRDLLWWFRTLNLDYSKVELNVYEGIPFLNKFWKGLFGMAFIFKIKK